MNFLFWFNKETITNQTCIQVLVTEYRVIWRKNS